MQHLVSPPYEPITEKPYCCVPAVLQMILVRRGLARLSQDEIAWELGLIVPNELVPLFKKVRTGPEPVNGYGTQTSRDEFSIDRYLQRAELGIRMMLIRPSDQFALSAAIATCLENGDDVVVCYNSRELFGDGDAEHVSLIQSFDRGSGELVVVDPAIGAPKLRITSIARLTVLLKHHNLSDRAGLWIFAAVN